MLIFDKASEEKNVFFGSCIADDSLTEGNHPNQSDYGKLN